MYRQVFGYAITVFGFWWVVLSSWAWVRGDVSLESGLYPSMLMLTLVGFGFVFGGVAVIIYIVVDRSTSISTLGATNVRGLKCTIGNVPLNAVAPAQAAALPNFEQMPDIPKDFYPLWLKHFAESHPAHVALASAMLKVYEAQRDLPATHVKGGHGGRTLLEHSLLVAYQMQTLAMTWSYTGLRDKTGKRVVLKLRNDNYAFSPLDPLVVLVGLAHDIGKIESYIWQGKEIVGSQHEHDLTGARVLARLSEMWGIPDEDRQAILLSIAHYHHPMELPLSPDRRAIDDRTIALMELLIKADFVASAIENKGVVPSERDYETTMDHRSDIHETDEAVWDAFMGIIEETGRINSPDPKHNLGCICLVTGQNSMRLVLREDAIRGAIMRRLGILDASPIGDGRYPLTMRLLRLLDKNGFLVRKIGQFEYAAESAFWEIDFFGKRRGSNKEEKITGWSSCIVVHPTISKYVSEMSSYGWAGHVLRGTLGKGRALKSGSTDPTLQAPDDESEGLAPAASAEDAAAVEEHLVGTNGTAPAEAASAPDGEDLEGPAGLKESALSANPEASDRVIFIPLKIPEKAHSAPKAPLVSQQRKEPKTPVPPKEAARPAPEISEPSVAPVASVKSLELHFPPAVKTTDYVIRTEEQGVKPATDRPSMALSPHALKSHCADYLRLETPQTAATGQSGREVYIVSGPALMLRVPAVNWGEQVPMLKVACQKDPRYSAFMVHEAGGIFYLVVDVEVMRSFMADENKGGAMATPDPIQSMSAPAATAAEDSAI